MISVLWGASVLRLAAPPLARAGFLLAGADEDGTTEPLWGNQAVFRIFLYRHTALLIDLAPSRGPAPFARDLGDDHWDRAPRRTWYDGFSSDESDEGSEAPDADDRGAAD